MCSSSCDQRHDRSSELVYPRASVAGIETQEGAVLRQLAPLPSTDYARPLERSPRRWPGFSWMELRDSHGYRSCSTAGGCGRSRSRCRCRPSLRPGEAQVGQPTPAVRPARVEVEEQLAVDLATSLSASNAVSQTATSAESKNVGRT